MSKVNKSKVRTDNCHQPAIMGKENPKAALAKVIEENYSNIQRS
jgi:hypothetical protein